MKRFCNVLLATLLNVVMLALAMGTIAAIAALTLAIGPVAATVGSLLVLAILLALLSTNWGKRDFWGTK